MAIVIGSARIDEKGHASGGAAGDQKQKSSTNDRKGEVSMQNFYVHTYGWYVLRPKSAEIAQDMADNMIYACNNVHLGYDQGNRNGVITNGIKTTKNTECDCSSLVRACVKEAAKKDPGNFTTYDEVSILEATGLFEKHVAYKDGMKLYNGDVLVSKKKGHTAIVVSGRKRTDTVAVTGNYTGAFPTLPSRGYFRNGDVNEQVKILKKFLNWYGNYGLTPTNPNYLNYTEECVKRFQRDEGLTADGEFGPKSLAAAKKVRK